MTCRPGMSIPSPEEMKYARHLFKLYAGNEVRAVATSPALNYHAARGQSTGFIVHPPNTKADKFRLIKDAALHTYVDLVGQVVKTFSEYDKYILYVTDYTEHRQLYDYAMVCEGHAGDEFNFTRAERKWPGPYGRMTLQVTLWEPHASFARQNVRKDDFLLLRNVHIKFGQSQDAMEGVLHTDRLYPKKVDIKPLDKDEPDERLRDLVKRKLQYWGRIGADLRKGSQKRALETGDTNTKKPKKDNSQNYKNAQGLSKDDTQVKDTVTTVLTERDKLNRHSEYIAKRPHIVDPQADPHSSLQAS